MFLLFQWLRQKAKLQVLLGNPSRNGSMDMLLHASPILESATLASLGRFKTSRRMKTRVPSPEPLAKNCFYFNFGEPPRSRTKVIPIRPAQTWHGRVSAHWLPLHCHFGFPWPILCQFSLKFLLDEHDSIIGHADLAKITERGFI